MTIAAASTTTPAVATHMTGSYPDRHDGVTTPADVFGRNGYRTLAHVTGPIVEETNFDSGFDT